ncbi:hypothetical protein ACWDX6_09200 [Streptomyces sp. NPDC003027]
MEIAELVLKYVEALVWPLVVVVLAWSFRRHQKRAFDRMTRLETPAGAIEFAEEAARTYEEVEGSSSVQASEDATVYGGTLMHSAGGHTRERDEAINQALELIATSPDSAVMIAWRAVETALRKAALQLPQEPESQRFFVATKAIRELTQRGLLSSHMANTMMNLSRLRARVSHGQHTVLPDAAFDYVASCELILGQLEAISNLGPAA